MGSVATARVSIRTVVADFSGSLRRSQRARSVSSVVRTSAAEVQADIAQLKSEGKKVQLSIGGANGLVELPTETGRQNFINSVSNLMTQYGLKAAKNYADKCVYL